MELAHASSHVYLTIRSIFMRKRGKESINTWTNDFSEASVVRMTPQKRGFKRTYPIDYQQKTKFSFVRTRFLVSSLFTSNFGLR